MAEIDSNYKYLKYEEMIKDVAEQALDNLVFDGKSLREWMRIIALEDCISRQAVLDTIGNVPDHDDGMVWEALSHAQRDVALLPSVTPVEKVGRWEYVQYDYNPKLGDWRCSECRSVVIECVDKNEKGGIPMYKYCPQCGKKMKEVENDFWI